MPRTEEPPAGPAWIPIAVRLLRRLPRRLGRFEASEIMAARTSDLRLVPRVPNAFTIRPAGPADEPLLDRFFGTAAASRRPRAPDGTCLLALGDGEVHAVEWIRWGPTRYLEDRPRLGVRFQVPARSCWLHNGRNLTPEGRGPWALIMGRLRTFLEPRGVETAFLQVDADDAYSIGCHQSLGFRRVGCLIAVHVLRAQFVRIRLEEKASWIRVHDELDLAQVEV